MATRREPRRITLDVDESTHELLREARLTDGVTTADRLRALLALWQEDGALADRVVTRARELVRERLDEDN